MAFARQWADPQIELHQAPEFPEARPSHQLDGIESYAREFLELIEDHTYRLEELLERGDDVLALVHEHGQGRASGVEIDWRPAFLFSFRNGKVARVQVYRDWAEAKAKLGLE